jgi:GMP synthase-like glutamine amidotransferase
MKILVVDNGSSYIGQLSALCRTFGKVQISVMGQVENAVADLLVLSGGHQYAVIPHPAEFTRELALIRNFNGPIIGICLGFELLAFADGGELVRLEREVQGIRQVQIVGHDSVFGPQKRFRVYEAHRWAVKSTRQLEVLATSPSGIEVVRHPSRPVYGFQFHPEQITGGTDGRNLFVKAVHFLTK